MQSPAFVFMAGAGDHGPAAGSAGSGRQLRLLDHVLAEHPVEGSDDGPGVTSAAAPADSLAAFIAELEAGSACFCCDAALEAGVRDSLQCPSCGAAVERPEAA